MDRFLAAFLLLTIFTIGGVTLGAHPREFAYAVVKGYQNHIREDGQPLRTVSARISALKGTMNRTLFGKDFFEKLNLGLQMALGKQIISVGGSTMVRLKTGQLYDLMGKTELSDDIAKMVRLKENLTQLGCEMLYVYPHCSLYEDGLLPGGVIDYNIEAADELVGSLRDAGIFVIDSREVYRSLGLDLDQAIYRTDQHWSTLTAFETFRATAAKLRDMGLAIDPALYDRDSFSVQTYPTLHMGQVGERLGQSLIEPDDFALILPRYETMLSRKIVNGSAVEEALGPFESLLNMKLLDDARRDGVANLYSVYGNHDAENWYVNDKVDTGRVLISKDSFGTPFANLLALTAHETLTVDLRKSQRTIEDYARVFKPDVVIVAHSQAMLREANYVFIE